ncbi:hypothetical protein BK712_02910 [Bacillus thuringiensis serovar seoulensis]|nr:hypothetical protein BK702_00940 [Bacillus thuringiensis serovar cameroun]OTX12974.1 hypothetical protein BK712_02910 [Bacillus thuringiensis serovar seoulensis]
MDILSFTQTSSLATEISKCIYKWLEVILFCFITKNEHPLTITLNCTPIVRHRLTIGDAVFLWLNLQLMKKYTSFNVI